MGDPCIPEDEYDPTFTGFSPGEVNVESRSYQCLTRLCLANHFQGRVTCPYGQSKDQSSLPGCDSNFNDGTTCQSFGPSGIQDKSNPPNTASPCLLPGTQKQVTGILGDTTVGAHVEPQCVDRTAGQTVYCSCRCANGQGQTNDGANYCSCPDGFTCEPLIASVQPGIDRELVGSYCIKKNTKYDLNSSCLTKCDPTLQPDNCPASPIQ